jgi:amidohydrolase
LLPDDSADELAALRRDIHAHPELSFEETRTSDLVARKLSEWGIAFAPRHGHHRHRRPPCTAATVAPVAAPSACAPTSTRCPSRSTTASPMPAVFAGVMHACGHDGHTHAAGRRQALRPPRDFDGTVYLIFQPAEEGRRRRGEDGRRRPVRALPDGSGVRHAQLAGLPSGHARREPGAGDGRGQLLSIVVRGVGSHAALPHRGIDPVPVACQLVMALQNIVSRNCKPIDTAVLSVTMLHAGEATNVVPDHCEIQGTVRTFRTEVLDLVERRMEQIWPPHLRRGRGRSASSSSTAARRRW